MKTKIINYPMNKKGQFAETIIASVMILVTIFSVITVVSEGNKVFVGDKSNNKFYDYSECKEKVDSLNPDNIVVFESEAYAKKAGFIKSGC